MISLTKNPKVIWTVFKQIYNWIDFFVFFAGILTTFAFSPFGLWPITLLSMGFLIFALNQTKSPLRSAIRGGLFGLGFFGTGVSWIYVSLHTYGGANFFISGLITLLFIIYLACYPALTSWTYHYLFKTSFILRTLLVFPCFWLLSELLRGFLFTGFPWLDLGYSGIHSPYACLAPLWGVYGVGLVMLFCASLVTLMIELKRWLKLIPFVCVILLSIVCYEGNFHVWTHKNQPLQITLIQGNISPSIKWDNNQAENSLDTYFNFTQQALKNSNLIIWPEDAFPYYQDQAESILNSLNQIGVDSHTNLLLGLPIEKNTNVYNGAMLIGVSHGMYLKRHLVPFGEYTPALLAPLDDWLGFPMSDFSPGPENQPLMQLILNPQHPISVGVMICYESIFPLEFQKSFQQADLLVSLSDDGWFGNSLGPWQHEEIAEMRAKESGRYLLSATNNGITAVINPDGTLQTQIPPNQARLLQTKVFSMSGQTPWMHLGLLPVLVLILFCLAMAYCYRPISIKTNAPD